MDSLASKMAYFSTNGGKYPPRPAPAIRSRAIIRGDLGDRDARDAFVTRLRKDFPDKCKDIAPDEPGSAAEVHQYFDAYDVSDHGLPYLALVIYQIGTENLCRKSDLAKFVEVWRDKNEDVFWSITHESTIHQVFNVEDLEAHDEEWLGEALKRIWGLRDLHVAKGPPTNTHLPNRGNFHSDPEQWVSDQVNEDISSKLTGSSPRTIVTRTLDGNPSSQIHSRIPSQLAVQLSHRVQFPLPPQPRPRRAPVPMPVSNDARVLERQEAQEASIPSYSAMPVLPVIPEQQSFSPLIRGLPVPNIKTTSTDTITEQPQTHRPAPAAQMSVPYIGNGQTPTVQPVKASPNTGGFPGQVNNAPIGLQWRMQIPPQQPDYNTRTANPAIPMLPLQSQFYRPSPAYGHPPPQPIYYGPQVQPHQLQNYAMLAGVSSVGNQRLYSVTSQSGQSDQKYVGKERRGSGASRDGPQSPQRRRKGCSSSGNSPQFVGDKLWVGNLSEHDTTQALVSIFGPLGGYEMSPMRKSPGKGPGLNAYYTFVRFHNDDQAAAAKEMLDRREFPQLGGRQLRISYAHYNVWLRDEGFQTRIRADTQHSVSYWNQPPTHLPSGRQLGAEPPSPPLFNYSGNTIPNQVASLHQRPRTPIPEENTPVDLASELPNHGTEADAEHSRRPRLTIDTALQHPPQQIASGEILPLRTDTTRSLGTMELSQGSNKVDSSINPVQISDTEHQRGKPPPSFDDRHSPHSTATDKTVLRTELGDGLDDQPFEEKISVHEATSGVGAQPGATRGEHQDAPPMAPRPPMARLESIVDVITAVPGGLAQATGADPDIGPSQFTAQEGASQGANHRTNKKSKKKPKSQPTSEAGRQGVTQSQIPEEVDREAAAKIEIAAAAAEIPGPQQAAAVPPVDRKRPPKKKKNKNRRQGGQVNLNVSTNATEPKVSVSSKDRLETDKEATAADMITTEHVVSQEMARGDSGSSQDPAPTPAFGQFSTKATTLAPSEGSDAETKLQEAPQMNSISDQRRAEKEEEAELLLNLSRGNLSPSIMKQFAIEKATRRTEKLQVNYPSRTSSQPPKKIALEVIPAVPDISKIHQRYWDEQRLREVQKCLENVDADVDRTAIKPTSDDAEKPSHSRESAIASGPAAKQEAKQLIVEHAEHAVGEPDSAIEQSGKTSIVESNAAIGKIDVTPESSPTKAQTSQSTGMKGTESGDSSSGEKGSEFAAPTEEPPTPYHSQKLQTSLESLHDVDDSQDPGLRVAVGASAGAVTAVMTHKKKQKKRQGTHSRDQSLSLKSDSQAAPSAGLAAETAVDSLSASESIKLTKEQDSSEAGKSLTDPQESLTPKEEHLDSAAGSEPDEAQQALPSDPATPTGPPKKKKKKSKKSKGKAKKANDQHEAIAASDEVAGPDNAGSTPSKHQVERPWDVDTEAPANKSKVALKNLLTAEKPDQVDGKASSSSARAKDKMRDLAPEVPQEPTNPKSPPMGELVDEYYAQKEKFYTPLLLNPKGPVVTEDRQDKAKQEPAKDLEHTSDAEYHDQRKDIQDWALDRPIEEPGPSISPRTHQKVMLEVMTDCGYILENGSNVEKENEPSQVEEHKKNEGMMSDPQIRDLQKLLHVAKTAIRKEYGSHDRATILNTLAPDVVEGYCEGSLGLGSAKFEELDDNTKAQVRRLAEIDKEEVKLKATLKENEDDAPESSPDALSASDRELQSLEFELFRGLKFDNSVKAFAAEIGDGLKDLDARREFEKAVPKVKENMEARCHALWMQSHEAFPRDADGRLTNTSRLAIGREITGPALRAMRAELTAKALEARFNAEKQKEKEDDTKLLPNFDDRVNTILGAMAQCIQDQDIIRGLQEKVAEAKQAVEEKFREQWAEFRKTLSKDQKGRWTVSSKEAIDQKFRVAALGEFHLQIRLKVLEPSDENVEQEENQRPTIGLHTSEPMSPRRRGSPALRASITHGDSTREVISVSGRRLKDISNMKANDVTPDLSPISGLFPDHTPLLLPRPPPIETSHAARMLGQVRAAQAKGPNLDPSISIRPVIPKEISWQWPGEPTPNLILKNVLYTRLANSNQYNAIFHIDPTDDLITNAADTCVECVIRDDVCVWFREHAVEDIAATDLRVVAVHDLNWLRETIDAGKEPTWQEVVAGAAEQGIYMIKQQTGTPSASQETKQRPFVERKAAPLESYLPEKHRGQSTGRRVGDLLWGVPRGERAWGCGTGEEAERVDPYFNRIA